MARRLCRRILLGLAALALSLAGLEGALRWLDPWRARPKLEMWRFVLAAKREDPDPRRGWHFAPGFEGEFGVPVRLNRLGFRGAEWGPPKEAEHRVLVLGDSLTFGYGVREEEAYPQVLEGLLGTPYRVLNAGAIGYNTDQAWQVLRKEGLPARPSAVLLLFVGNDDQPTPTDPRMAGVREAAAAWDREHPFKSLLWEPRGPLQYTLLYVGYYLQWKTKLLSRIAQERAVDCPQGRAACLEALTGIRDDCRARGIPFGVLLYEDDEGIRAFLEEKGIPHAVHFQSPAEAEPYVLCPVDSHPSVEGHRKLAEAFRRLMEQAGMR